jgi:hypothetical protein
MQGEGYASYGETPEGAHGTLTAEILETRQSDHVGDMFRGIGPTTPDKGEVLTLGTGALWRGESYGAPTLGLKPDDGRDSDWLDPRALYRCHSQTVRLRFEPS